MKTKAFLIRGLWGFLWSRGMDALAGKLMAAGIEAEVWSKGIVGYLNVRRIADAAFDAAASGRKIILGGHSMGADAAVMVAEKLAAKKVSVALLATFDPTPFGCPPLPGNVAKAINFYQRNSALGRAEFKPGPGFKGLLLQRRVDTIHVRSDDDPKLHAVVLAEAAALLTTNTKAPR